MSQLILAPLEGCMDWSVRELLSEIGGFDRCVTEFVRVTDSPLPARSFYRLSPELHRGGKTRHGTPVRVQLLGSNPVMLAESAQLALSLGSPGIDFNLGCPSKTVNGSGGGAALLKTPDVIARCVTALAQAIPDDKTFSVKIRLGYDNPDDVFHLVSTIADAGADELVIHARTKKDGYKAEAIKWDYIRRAAERVKLPIIANGEVWSKEDYIACQKITGCETIMIGRGAMSLPNIGYTIKEDHPPMAWPDILALLIRYADYDDEKQWYPGRCKQWLKYLRRQYPEQAPSLFKLISRITSTPVLIDILKQHEEIALNAE